MSNALVRDGLVVQWPDTHIPDHNPRAVRSMLRFLAEVQPDLVIFTGDLYDFLSVARWTADTVDEKGEHLQREIDAGWRILNEFRNVYEGRAVFLPGNHEERLAKWGRMRGKGIYGIDALKLGSLLGLDALDIETPAGADTAERAFQFAPDAVAIHGAAIHSKAGYSVTKELDRFGLATSVVMGHTHRLATVYRQAWGGKRLWGVEGGHFMDQRKANYLSYGVADWQQGFSVIHVSKGVSVPTVVPMTAGGRFVYERTAYAA